jgi:hypothetical protein
MLNLLFLLCISNRWKQESPFSEREIPNTVYLDYFGMKLTRSCKYLEALGYPPSLDP